MTPESGPMPSDRVGGKEHKEINMPSVSFGRHFEMHPIVFPAGALIVLALVSLTFLLPPDRVQGVFDSAKNTIGNSFGWLYVAALTGFLIFAIRLAFGKYGAVKLGKDDEEPEFGRLTWFSMLFSAGMGIGLVFWSVAEPVYHYNTTPPGLADGLEKSRVSMAVTIFHWGLHPWALYAVVALALAYFGFRRGMPLGFRSLLYPLLGERVWGRTGDVIDTLAIIATLTGVATSLGIGAQQVNAGLSHLFGLPINVRMQVGLIAGITAVATVSVVAGLHTGIRRLSELNMSLAGLLMVLVILGGGVLAFFGSRSRTPARISSCSRSARSGPAPSTPRDANGSTRGPCSTGRGGFRGRHSSGCSSRAFRAGERSASSSSACCSCPRRSGSSGSPRSGQARSGSTSSISRRPGRIRPPSRVMMIW